MFQITVVADGETIWNMCSLLLYRKVKSLETERPAPVRAHHSRLQLSLSLHNSFPHTGSKIFPALQHYRSPNYLLLILFILSLIYK